MNNSTLRDQGYKYQVPHSWSNNQYRLYAALLLEMHGLLPTVAEPTTVETLLALYREEFGMTPVYKERLLMQSGAFGVTISKTNSAPVIILDKDLLTDSPKYKILHRTTLAHELGHAFLHSDEVCYRAAAYTQVPSTEFFDFKKWWHNVDYKKNKPDFQEFQANQIMVGLLLPFTTSIPHFAKTAKLKLDMLKHTDGYSIPVAITYRYYEILEWIVRQISECFNVSKEMSKIELLRLLKCPESRIIIRGERYLPLPADMI